jgi:D-xylulose kinase
MYAIGIDSGTQGTKALVADFESGRVLGLGHAPHDMVSGLPPGASEQRPGTWVKAMETALATALRESKVDPKKVVSLGISGQQHGFVPLDPKGRPIRPAKIWNDTSTIEETEFLVGRLGGRKGFIRKLGVNLAVGFTASKILWLKNHEPENFKRLATVLLPHNYLNYHLTGRVHMEYGDASGTGLMDIRTLRWSAEAAEAIDQGLAGKLPPLSHPREPVGFVRKAVAAKFGLGRVLVSGGGGDNMMGAIGTGNVSPGVSTVSLGTSGTIYSFFDEPFVDPEGEIAAFCDSTGGWLPLLCTMNVTNTTEIVKALFGLTNRKLEAVAAKAAPGAGGLLFLPFIDGERVPVLPYASAVFFGLNRKTFSRPHLARAVMEGTMLNLGYGFARMRELGLKPDEIRATGGGSKSRLWLQIAADVLQTPVVTLKEKEAAAFGGALQSIWSYLLEKGEKAAIRNIAKARVALDKLAAEPDPRNRGTYEALQERFNSLWRTLEPEFRAQKQASSRL